MKIPLSTNPNIIQIIILTLIKKIYFFTINQVYAFNYNEMNNVKNYVLLLTLKQFESKALLKKS